MKSLSNSKKEKITIITILKSIRIIKIVIINYGEKK